MVRGTRDWFFPNGNPVGSRIARSMTNNISRTRGPQSLILHRDTVISPTGVYHCQILTENTYVGLYSSSGGKIC